ELVGVAQAFHVDDPVIVADHHGVLQGRAQGKTGGPEALDILHEAKGARPSDLAAEAFRIEIEGQRLAPDCRAVEVDVDLEPRPFIGPEFGPGTAGVDTHRLDDTNVATAGGKAFDADLFEGVDIKCGAAVENRHFVAVDVDQDVVDTEPEHRCHQ